jgi:hypothetical protein
MIDKDTEYKVCSKVVAGLPLRHYTAKVRKWVQAGCDDDETNWCDDDETNWLRR